MTNLEEAPQEQDCTARTAGTAGTARDTRGTRLIVGRDVPLGGVRGITVNRTLPSRDVPTIGAWCFLDRFGPAPAEAMVVLPHPHTALQTVTWPLSGRIRHRDSVGSDVIVRPGELNLMTAGRGVAHSEISLPDRARLGGLQLWVALPDEALAIAPSFEQHTALPSIDVGSSTVTVLVGELAGARSAATTYTPLVGAQLAIRSGETELALRSDFEYGLMVLRGSVLVDGDRLEPGPLLRLGSGRDGVELAATGDAELIMIGGAPFTSELIMWWNFIGRSHDDIVAAREDWQQHAERFGTVAGHDGARIPAPPMPTTRLKPRRRRA
jgi:redox-sensitive bicupin YhaK (pirin superfamily)